MVKILVEMKNVIVLILTLGISCNVAFSQCYPDRHSTNANDGWISCTKTSNPRNNSSTHWILYNLGQTKNLYKSTFWNSNHPNHLAWGVKNVRFDYSTDSINWKYLTTYEFAKAPGHSLYEGEPGPSFNGAAAKFVLITPLSNYGAVCYGFSEIRIDTGSAPANALSLNISPCVNSGVIYNINSGINLGGSYSGYGVVNNYDLMLLAPVHIL